MCFANINDNKIKGLLWIVIATVFIAFGYAAISYVDTYSKSIEPSAFRSFSVSGEGKITAIPDVAQFTFSVITEGGKDIAKLQKENTDKVNKAIDFVKSQGVEVKDIKTLNYNLDPQYQYFSCPRPLVGEAKPCPPAEIIGYKITQTVQIKVRDFAKIGVILSGVVDRGANDVSQLSFTIDDPTKMQDSAREQAISKAREKAKLIAKAGDFKVGRLLGIDEGFGGVPYYKYAPAVAESFGAGGAAPSPTIEPGSQEISVTVTLRYEIE